MDTCKLKITIKDDLTITIQAAGDSTTKPAGKLDLDELRVNTINFLVNLLTQKPVGSSEIPELINKYLPEKFPEDKGKLELDRLDVDTIRFLVNRVTKKSRDSRRTLELIGKHLYSAIFNETVKKSLKDVSDNKNKDEKIKLRIGFENCESPIAQLPWEYLYFINENIFVSTDKTYALSRELSEISGKDSNPDEYPLRILFVIPNIVDRELASSSKGFVDELVESVNDLNKAKVGESISENSASKPKVIGDKVDNPTTLRQIISKLDDAIEKKEKFHVLHYIGLVGYHYDSNETLQIALGNGKQEHLITVADFVAGLNRLKEKPNLILLHQCEEIESSLKLVNLVKLMKNFISDGGIQSVVAMQYPADDPSAKSFSKVFYAKLVDRANIDSAIQEARFQLSMEYTANNHPQYSSFGKPVLFTQNSDPIIKSEEKPEKDSRNTHPPVINKNTPTNKPITQNSNPIIVPEEKPEEDSRNTQPPVINKNTPTNKSTKSNITYSSQNETDVSGDTDQIEINKQISSVPNNNDQPDTANNKWTPPANLSYDGCAYAYNDELILG